MWKLSGCWLDGESGHARIAVAQHDHVVVADEPGRPVELERADLGHLGLHGIGVHPEERAALLGQAGVEEVALLAAGAAHQHRADALGVVAGDRGGALGGLVVGVGVERHEAQRLGSSRRGTDDTGGHGNRAERQPCVGTVIAAMDDPEVWRWIWLIAAFACAGGEIATGGAFVLLPFAAGALVAAFLAFLGVSVVVELIAFVAVSVAALAALYPLRRHLDRSQPQDGIGARRLLGQPAVVLAAIAPADEGGLVRVGREDWRAESLDGAPIAPGTPVKVVEVRGTRVIVYPRPGPPPTKESSLP